MIPHTGPDCQIRWQKLLSRAVRDPAELLALLELPRDELPLARRAARLFPLRVPRGYVARMEKGNPLDPLLLQVLPHGLEFEEKPGFDTDPVGDMDAMVVPGLLHKYRGRVLLVTTGACGIHCRYCFRRHFPYQQSTSSASRWRPALDYITSDRSIREVILSGGDPLNLGDDKLAQLASELGRIPHLRRLRIHSRLPIVLPERVDEALLGWLSTTPLQVVMVVHANHPQELGPEVAIAMNKLRQQGITLLNQSVLLRSVNDQADALRQLSERLFEMGVLPYYLHLLDRVSGASHFEIGESRALEIVQQLRHELPGYLVPRLVRETAGEMSKMPLVS